MLAHIPTLLLCQGCYSADCSALDQELLPRGF